jgi:hypothetical protein
VDEVAEDAISVAEDMLRVHEASLLCAGHCLYDNRLEPCVELLGFSRAGWVATFQVSIWGFQVKAVLLNVPKSAPPLSRSEIRHGSFGKVFRAQTSCKTYAVKRISFHKQCQFPGQPRDNPIKGLSYSDLHDILMEYSVGRICGHFGVGPKMQEDLPFDLVCFRDCV